MTYDFLFLLNKEKNVSLTKVYGKACKYQYY